MFEIEQHRVKLLEYQSLQNGEDLFKMNEKEDVVDYNKELEALENLMI